MPIFKVLSPQPRKKSLEALKTQGSSVLHFLEAGQKNGSVKKKRDDACLT